MNKFQLIILWSAIALISSAWEVIFTYRKKHLKKGFKIATYFSIPILLFIKITLLIKIIYFNDDTFIEILSWSDTFRIIFSSASYILLFYMIWWSWSGKNAKNSVMKKWLYTILAFHLTSLLLIIINAGSEYSTIYTSYYEGSGSTTIKTSISLAIGTIISALAWIVVYKIYIKEKLPLIVRSLMIYAVVIISKFILSKFYLTYPWSKVIALTKEKFNVSDLYDYNSTVVTLEFLLRWFFGLLAFNIFAKMKKRESTLMFVFFGAQVLVFAIWAIQRLPIWLS